MTIGAVVRQRVDHEDFEKVLVEMLKWSELSTTITFAAGAANTCVFTVQVVDATGAPVAAVFNLAAYFSSSAAGANLTATAFSGTLVATTGAVLTAFVAAKYFDVITDATGKFVGVLTDTAKTTGQYFVIPRPRGDMQLAGPTVTGSYG
jgi:hypothetical protein